MCKGEFFGDLDCLMGLEKRNYSAKALEDCEFWVFPRFLFEKVNLINQINEFISKHNEQSIRHFFSTKTREGKELDEVVKAVRKHAMILTFKECNKEISMQIFMQAARFCVAHVFTGY